MPGSEVPLVLIDGDTSAAGPAGRPPPSRTRGPARGAPRGPRHGPAAPAARGLRIHACNARALAEGIREGEALADVRARIPGLVTRPADPAGDQAALEKLALWCGRYGPAVATDGPRGLWIDVTGAAHLLGGEAALLADLARRLAAFGLTARLGLGSTRTAAAALARFSPHGGHPERPHPGRPHSGRPHSGRPHSGHIAPVGGAAVALAGLPVAALGLDAATVLVLHRLGLRRIGQLHDLPRAALERRFPPSGAARETARAVLGRLDQALGSAAEPLVALAPPPRHAVRRLFEAPLISNEGLLASLGEAVAELCALLAAHQVGARRIALVLYRADGSCLEQVVGFSAPTRTPGHIGRLLCERLERAEAGRSGWPGDDRHSGSEGGLPGGLGGGVPGALAGLGIDAIGLSATRTQELGPRQTGLLAEAAASGAVAALVDRLVNRLGPRRVLRLSPNASHIPERAVRRVPALEPATTVAVTGAAAGGAPAGGAPGGAGQPGLALEPGRGPPAQTFARAGRPPRPYLLLEPPEPIRVVADIPEGPPARFVWRRVARRIVAAEGPERIAPEWWRALPAARVASASKVPAKPQRVECDLERTRDYYRIEDDEGARYWVFRDGLYQQRDGQQRDGQQRDGQQRDGQQRDGDSRAPPRWYLHGLSA